MFGKLNDVRYRLGREMSPRPYLLARLYDVPSIPDAELEEVQDEGDHIEHMEGSE